MSRGFVFGKAFAASQWRRLCRVLKKIILFFLGADVINTVTVLFLFLFIY